MVLSACNSGSDDTNASTQPPVTSQCDSTWPTIAALHQSGAYDDNDAHTFRAVVHADFSGTDQLGGFYVQSAAGEWSENAPYPQGVFVRSNTSYGAVEVGDKVIVTGQWGRNADEVQVTLTDDIMLCKRNADIVISDLRLPVADIAELERLRGMAIRVPDALSVINTFQLARFGEVQLASDMLWQPTEFLPPGDEAEAYFSKLERKQITLTDGRSIQNPSEIPYPAPELTFDNTLRIGDAMYDIVGAFSYQHDAFRVHPTQAPRIEAVNIRPESPELPRSGDLTVASVNLWDYFPTELNDFERQRPKVVNAIHAMDADVYAVQELFNDGFGAQSSVQDLVNALNQSVSGNPYAFVTFTDGPVGAANITNGLIYRRDRVRQVGTAAYLDADAFAFRTHRPPVVQTFELLTGGTRFTVSSNHIRSRHCGNEGNRFRDHRDGQGCASVARREAMEDMLPWLNTNPTGVDGVPVIVAGDFNSYRLEDPARLMEAAGFTNAADLADGTPYSYTFQGLLGSLDYVFMSAGITDSVTGVSHWRINADEPQAFSFSRRFKSERQQTIWHSEQFYRMSDHNPVIVEFDTSVW